MKLIGFTTTTPKERKTERDRDIKVDGAEGTRYKSWEEEGISTVIYY